jgi:hypothetical protein
MRPGAARRAIAHRRARLRLAGAALLAVLLPGALVTDAHAGNGGSIHLGYSDCSAAGTSTAALTNACTSSTGSIVIVGSFNPPVSMPHLVAFEGEVGIFTSGTDLSPWWHFETAPSAGCRAGRLSASFTFDAAQQTACSDVWAGQAMGATDFLINPMGTGPNTAVIRLVCAIPQLDGVPVNPSIEYYAFKLQISRSQSSGPGVCSGCLDRACFVFDYASLEQPVGVGDYVITQGYQNSISYNGGTADANCAGSRTLRGSWGLIKSIYR